MRSLQPFQGWRLTFFQGVMVAVFLIFGLRLYQWQILDSTNFQLAADDNRLSELPIPADRGVIFDRYDLTLAGNSPAYNVTIIPAALPADQTEVLEIFNRISALTDVPPTRALARASGRDVRSIEELVAEGEGIAPFRPVIVAQDIDFHDMLQIREETFDLPGVDVQTIAVREYPYGALTSHIVGYMGPIPEAEAEQLIEQGYNPAFDRIGYDGLEAFMEDVLAGQRGSVLREVDVAGEVQREIAFTPSTGGLNLRLTIDVELQQAAQQALLDGIARVNQNRGQVVTQSGVVIAMNPMTGEILALVSYPSYDSSRFARAIDAQYYLDIIEQRPSPLLNQGVASAFPPGSAWKLITAAAVMEEDVIDPETQLFDGGDLLVANYYAPNDRAADQRFVCYQRTGHGNVNVREAIAASCNVYFYQVGGGNPAISPNLLRPGGLNISNLFRYSTALGIGSYTGIELFSEAYTRMPDPDWKRRNQGENWSTGDTYNASFGQGYITVTPLQLANSVAAIVNDGTLFQPTLIREYLDAEGNVLRPFDPLVMRTLNLANVPPGEPLTLLMLEDMIMKGPNSLSCACAPGTDFYNPNRCNPDAYRAQVDINPDPFATDIREYQVYVPEGFNFNRLGMCSPVRFDESYTPAFLSSDSMQIVREGMRLTVSQGTAGGANLPNVEVAGKTGTAEYCDDIAQALGQCIPGQWNSHAWFTAYAPYNNPEILIVAFIYNGGEGSAYALPVAVNTLEEYFRIQANRTGQTPFEAQGVQPTNPAVPRETPAATPPPANPVGGSAGTSSEAPSSLNSTGTP
ncbi:MAG: penicillin-binding transpeptidase domain-containing protein [bacterium]|nr:penicillin-binding transpeptidase domain-containing protein [bacterium]